MTRLTVLLSVVVVVNQSGCYGGCPLLPARGTVGSSPELSCLVAHVVGSQETDGSSRCFDGVTVEVTNRCGEGVQLTVAPMDPALIVGRGATMRFDIDEVQGVGTARDVRWTIPMQLGTGQFSLDVTVPRS